jgi:integrase
MRRRDFIIKIIAGSAASCPLAAFAQQPSMPVIGFLSTQSPGSIPRWMTAFHQGLKEIGFVEGQNVAIEYRWAEGRYNRLPELAAELVRRQVAVIAATGGDPSPQSAKAATQTIPIVFTANGDPVREGLVASLNRPGGNVTGITIFGSAAVAKRVQLIHEFIPKAATIAYLTEAGQLWLKSREAAGIERSTLDGYRQHLDLHITPLIGATKLAALTVPFVRTFEDRLRQERSPAMVKKVLASLSSILADAQDRGLVAQNVAHQRRVRNKGTANARQKRLLQVGVDIPTPDEIRAIIGSLEGRWRPVLLTAIFTGLRASELRGLRWNDVDLSRNELHVRQRADRFHTLGAPKSATSQRSIPLLPMVTNALREWRLAAPRNEFGLVFPGSQERPITLAAIIEMNWMLVGFLMSATIALTVLRVQRMRPPIGDAAGDGDRALRPGSLAAQ